MTDIPDTELWRYGQEAKELILELRVEIERWRNHWRTCDEQAQQFRTEIERLRAALKVCAHPLTDWTVATKTARRALEGK